MERAVILRSYWEAINKIKDSEDKIELLEAIIEYQLNGKEPNLFGITDIIWTTIKPNIDSSIKHYKNGKKGGAPKGNTNAKKQPPLNTDTTPVVLKQPPLNEETTPLELKNNLKQTDKDKEKDKEKDKDKDKEKEKNKDKKMEELLNNQHLVNEYVK